ncbi:MAG: helix-turn-helix domain-containing protein [Desulfobacteraceae bacterium]|nr:helix-turn-helix domain-containing protein [Desulfobacteraceae bacterium]
MGKKNTDNSQPIETNSQSCSVCKDLLSNMQRFLNILETSHRSVELDWLTVDDIASELKISKSIVYRLIRSGELGAVNLAQNNGKISPKGRYRTKRSSLNQYLESKKIRPFPNESTDTSRRKHFPKVKNHLGL